MFFEKDAIKATKDESTIVIKFKETSKELSIPYDKEKVNSIITSKIVIVEKCRERIFVINGALGKMPEDKDTLFCDRHSQEENLKKMKQECTLRAMYYLEVICKLIILYRKKFGTWDPVSSSSNRQDGDKQDMDENAICPLAEFHL